MTNLVDSLLTCLMKSTGQLLVMVSALLLNSSKCGPPNTLLDNVVWVSVRNVGSSGTIAVALVVARTERMCTIFYAVLTHA